MAQQFCSIVYNVINNKPVAITLTTLFVCFNDLIIVLLDAAFGADLPSATLLRLSP